MKAGMMATSTLAAFRWVGVATSPDLVNWERRGEALRESDIPLANAGLHTIEVAYIDDKLELFVEVDRR